MSQFELWVYLSPERAATWTFLLFASFLVTAAFFSDLFED